MQDFFTELDVDLLGTKKTPPLPPPVRQSPVPHVEKIAETPRVSNIPRNISPVPKQERHATRARTVEKTTNVASNHVVEMRSQMMKAGVVAIVFKADEKTRTLLGHLKLETRGFAYLEEVREAHKLVIKRARASYEDTVKDIPDIEEKDLLKIIRRDLELFLLQKFERNPVIIPMILYV